MENATNSEQSKPVSVECGVRHMYPSTFKGSTDPADTSGLATFMVAGQKFELHLATFADYQKIYTMLDLADKQSKQFATLTINDAVQRAIRDKAQMFGIYDLSAGA